MNSARLGLIKTGFVDYPGLVAATVFTHGCNLRCPYCHNPELVDTPPPDDLLEADAVLTFLRKRRAVLGGVCISGGEPLLHAWLFGFASAVHELGLKVKLDTNGLLPQRIEAVQADYVALDIKTAPGRYHLLGGRPDAGDRVREAIDVVRATAPAYEFRTTVAPAIVGEEDIRAIVALLEPGEPFTLAAFRPGRTLDPSYAAAPPPSAAVMAGYAEIARAAGLDVRVREHFIGGAAGNPSEART